MKLKATFIKGVNTIFAAFEEAVKPAKYVVITGDGFEDDVETSYDVRVIIDKFSQDDVQKTSFSDLIQHTDMKGLIPGEDVTVPMKASNILDIEGRRLAIVAFDTDPYEALFTVLLRDTA